MGYISDYYRDPGKEWYEEYKDEITNQTHMEKEQKTSQGEEEKKGGK